MFRLTTEERAKHGLPALVRSSRLGAVAYRHSAAMCRRRFFDHVDPDGLDPGGRVATFFPEHRGAVRENIFKADSGWDLIDGEQDVEAVGGQIVDGWMQSPGHRENILQRDLTHLGVGVYATTNAVFATQLLANTLAVFVNMPPTRLQRGAIARVELDLGRDLASLPSLHAYLRWPDSNRRFPVGPGRFALGNQPLPLRRTGTRAATELRAGGPPGQYRLLIGDTSGLHPLLTFEVT